MISPITKGNFSNNRHSALYEPFKFFMCLSQGISAKDEPMIVTFKTSNAITRSLQSKFICLNVAHEEEFQVRKFESHLRKGSGKSSHRTRGNVYNLSFDLNKIPKQQ